ncbi:MAG: hypothetical protein JJE04_12140 [Acidobacteriia bacterium]|nr:hypothetical protein [Terriglobia bacterium]
MTEAEGSIAPAELTCSRLRRIGEGIGRVVYGSQHWVVKRERTPVEVVALILVWKLLRKLPAGLTRRLLERPSKRVRLMRLFTQAGLLVIPMQVWFTSHVREIRKLYRSRDLRGERLTQTYLAGTSLIPRRITFPPTRVKIAGWPGHLTVTEAEERVESTLYQRLATLASAGQFELLEEWLNRFLDLRQQGWQRGLFSVDAHLKNFGVTGDRIVLIDPGGVTDRWEDVEAKLCFEEVVSQPHVQLGLGPVLGGCPEVASRFNARWKALVNASVVWGHWPKPSDSL